MTSDSLPIELALARSVTPPRPSDRAISFSISPQGEAVIAWASPEDEARLHARRKSRGGASFPQSMLARPASLRVTIDGNGDRTIRELTEVRCAFPSVHALPGDRLLVVGARALYTENGGEPNAEVFDADDRLALEACVGDGVRSISTTMGGSIWVGYFDEGVIGNYGWGEQDRRPIGAGGLNCFGPDLSLRWSYPAEDGDILDCYALTTTGEDCFVCPYTDWPILRITGADHRIDEWRNTITGARAMLAIGNQVALVGGYQGERDRVVAGSLEHDQVRMSPIIGRLRLSDRDFDPGTALVGRDGVLHAWADQSWYTLDLSAIADMLRGR